MCEVMKTKSTYWSVIRSLVATIVAVMGFAMVSVGQTYEIQKGQNISRFSDFSNCGSLWWATVDVGAYWNFQILKNGSAIDITSYTIGGYGNLHNLGWGNFTVGDNSGSNPERIYVVLDETNKTLTSYQTESFCGPTISAITDGSSEITSVCLNDDAARNAITAPATVTGAASGSEHQGWTINGEKNTTLTLDYIKDPDNMAALNGVTLQYWAEDESHVVAFSNEVTLSVCLPEVGSIDNSATMICLNKKELDDIVPTVEYPSGMSESDFTQGWEIVETGTTISTMDEANSNYGKTIRYYVTDNASGLTVYSTNSPTLASLPEVRVGTMTYCQNMPITEFPPILALEANGSAITTQYWRIYGSSGWENYTSQVIGPDYSVLAYRVGNACGSLGSGGVWSNSRCWFSKYDVPAAPVVEDIIVKKNEEASLPDFNGEYKLTSASEWTKFYAGDRIGPFTCADGTTEYDIAEYDEHGCISESTTFSVSVGLGIDSLYNMGDVTMCSNAPKTLKIVASNCGTAVTYQWYKDGEAISGATSNSYEPSTAGEYYCIASSAGQNVQSPSANVTTVAPATVTMTSDKTGSIFCTDAVAATLQVTDSEGTDITNKIKRVFWTKNGVIDVLSSSLQHNFTFDCEDDNGSFELGAYLTDPNGCVATVADEVTVDVDNSYTVYYYCGETGADSHPEVLTNWCTSASGTPGNCTSPSNFTTSACKYIITKDNVQLNEPWTVSGKGSKIIVGDGKWNKTSLPTIDVFSPATKQPSLGLPEGTYAEYVSSLTGTTWIPKLSKVANRDLRSYSKSFTINDNLTTGDDVKVDVRAGSSLVVATSEGSFQLGTMETDEVISKTGDANGYYNIYVNPGSSVTYTGDGVKNILSGQYSQLYIEPDSESDNIIMQEGATIEILQSFVPTKPSGSANTWLRDNVSINNSSFIFSGYVNQTIPRCNYNNILVVGSSKKSLSSAWVRNSLNVSFASTLDVSGNLYLYGSGNTAFINNGRVTCDNTSTVFYSSSEPTHVAPVNYGNLNLGAGERTFSTTGIIGVSNTMTVGSATCTTTGSTVEFNGSGAQTVPALEYYNLTLNNTGLDGSNSYQVSLGGDVVVNNQLALVEGVLNTNGNSLSLTSSSSNAVGQGYRYSADSASYVIGNITRALPSNLSGDGSETYIFPVGTSDNYMPLSMSKITTNSNASATVGTTTTVSSTSCTSPLTSVNTNAYWHIDGTNYESSSVSVTSTNGLYSCNTLGFKSDAENSFVNVIGCSVSDKSICSSTEVSGNGTVALANRTINANTYYYNCNLTSSDITNVMSWWTGQYASGTHPTSFDEDDATWIIDCGTTISKDFAISGSNTKVYFNIKAGDVLVVNADVSLPIVEHKQGVVSIERNSSLSLMNSYSMEDVSGQSYAANRCSILNEGDLNIYNSTLEISNGLIDNEGTVTMTNVDLNMSSDSWWSSNTWSNGAGRLGRFVNGGVVKMYSSNVYIEGGNSNATNLRNKAGAVWLVDNSTAPYKKVNFYDVEFWDDAMRYCYFECGSSFVVKGSDVEMTYRGNDNGCHAYLEGEFVVYDGNLTIQRTDQGGGNFTVKECGKLYMIDTDGNDDGVLVVSGTSGWQVNVEGTVYAVGIVNKGTGSGNSFNVKDDAEIFVGDIGVGSATDKTWEFSVAVNQGGTMNYCGNRTSGGDGIGTNDGTLNYAGSFYIGTDPRSEDDISGSGSQNLMFVDGEECMATYTEVVKGNQGSIMLPVELTMLYGVCKNGNVELHWQTASESNNEGFVILRSFDGVNFVEIAEVMGAGTSTETINYMYVDEDDKTGMVYYKLRQVDFDGKTKESKIVAVQTCGPNAQFAIAEDEITVSFKNPEETNYVVVTSLSGKIVFSKSFKDVAEARIASPRIKGVYIISVIDSKQITSEKFIK